MYSVLDIVTANGRRMRFLFIPAGEAGPVPVRVPQGHPHAITEVYDRTRNFDIEHGHFTGAYYATEDLIDRRLGAALAPAVGVHAWDADGSVMDLVAEWLRSLVNRSVGIAATAAE